MVKHNDLKHDIARHTLKFVHALGLSSVPFKRPLLDALIQQDIQKL